MPGESSRGRSRAGLRGPAPIADQGGEDGEQADDGHDDAAPREEDQPDQGQYELCDTDSKRSRHGRFLTGIQTRKTTRRSSVISRTAQAGPSFVLPDALKPP